MSKISTRQELDAALAAGCAIPGCDHTGHDGPMYLHGRCHMSSQVVATYQNGVLRILCGTCNGQIVAVRVADGVKQ